MSGIRKIRYEEVVPDHKNEHKGFEYFKHSMVPKGTANQCAVSVYQVPPGKSAYPYHSHTNNEESFYILQGTGLVKTPDGLIEVSPGDFLFFPADESGAHKITNTSETEMLVYLDFDTSNRVDAALYPDSGKIGIARGKAYAFFRLTDKVDYYDGE